MSGLSTYPTASVRVCGRLVLLHLASPGSVLLRYRERSQQRVAAIPLTPDTMWLLDDAFRTELSARSAMAARGLGMTAHEALALSDLVRP